MHAKRTRDDLVRQSECAQTLAGKLSKVVFRSADQCFLSRAEPLDDHVVRALDEQVHLPVWLAIFAQLPNDHAHTLTRAREVENVEQLVPFVLRVPGEWRLQGEHLAVASSEDETNIGRGLYERGFVRALCLVLNRTSVRVDRDERSVTQGKDSPEAVEHTSVPVLRRARDSLLGSADI